jgi:hypothetical protein
MNLADKRLAVMVPDNLVDHIDFEGIIAGSRCIMESREQAEEIHTREDLVLFIHHLVRDLRACPERWENTSLDAYLAAVAAWVQDMEGYIAIEGRRPRNIQHGSI